ncbi:MAG: EAL domain-containing protein [Acholeplasmatales bacterium]|nr:EAL domain-containing protein [Acholeplasmatales bacterium]
MRLRDLKWYILACLVLVVSYAAIAFCYYLPVRSRAEESMKVLAEEAINVQIELANEKISAAREAFLLDPTTLDTSFNQTGLRTVFAEKGTDIIFAKESDFIPSLYDSQGYYFYFFNENYESDSRKGICGKLPMSALFENSDFSCYSFDRMGQMYYNNAEFDGALFRDLIGGSFDVDYTLGETNSFTQVFDVNDTRGVITSAKLCEGIENVYDDIYVAMFIEIDDPYLAIEWILSQAMIFYAMGIAILLIMLFILIAGCKKASKLLRVDRGATRVAKSVVLRVSNHGKVIFTNKAFKQIYGITKLENLNEFKQADTDEEIMKVIKQGDAFECYVPVGDDIRYFHLSPLHIADSYYLMGSDITIDYLRRKHLELMNGKNEITGCDNSFTLTNQYNHIMLNQTFYDIAFIEYNIFKYEETVGVFGRQSFNSLLIEFLSILRTTYEELQIYHIDDAKFIVVYPHSDLNEVTKKINTSLDILRRPFTINSNNIYIKCKICVYNVKQGQGEEIMLPTIRQKLELALRNIADFSNKDYIIYDPLMDNVIEAAEIMEKDLIKGLRDNEFRIHLQPQYNIIKNQIVGFEALIRWANPKYKDKSPQAFIELAEQRGYMLDIGRFVFKECFRLAKEMEAYNVHISMNVSPIQILQVGFVNEIIEEADRLKINPKNIAIEITETFLMGNFSLVNEKLKLLKEKGFHIHLDDFCTGYSSMLYLKDLPADTIKIDKEFTKYVETSKVHMNIVRAICSLATSLDLGIVCEGVESQAQSDVVRKMGCEVIQGYLIGKALPFEDAVELLNKYNGKPRGR